MIVEAEVPPMERVADLMRENDELLAILTTVVKRERGRPQ